MLCEFECYLYVDVLNKDSHVDRECALLFRLAVAYFDRNLSSGIVLTSHVLLKRFGFYAHSNCIAALGCFPLHMLGLRHYEQLVLSLFPSERVASLGACRV